MNDVIEFLKQYIWKNGFEKLSKNPFDVYKAMIKSGVDKKTARLVLVTLMSKTHEMARNGCPVEELTDHIQLEHYLNKKTTEDLTSMYLELFSDENEKLWGEAKEVGFEEFCRKKWTANWEGKCGWHTRNGGSFPCSAEASLTFSVGDKEELHSHLSSELKSNPFLSADDIFGILEKQIKADLDNDMDEFCNADDYYEPYFEEFIGDGTSESEAKWNDWGLEIVDFTGSGDIDFEPFGPRY